MNWSELGMQVLSYLIPVFGAVVVGLVSWALSLLARKWGIQLDFAKDSAIRLAIRAAIGGAEEWAARRLKLDEPYEVIGAEKARWVHDRISLLWPKLLPDALDKMIDEELAGMYGVGATGDQVVGAIPDYLPDPDCDPDEEEG